MVMVSYQGMFMLVSVNLDKNTGAWAMARQISLSGP